MSAFSQPIVLNFKATSSIPTYEFTLSAGQIIFVDTPTGTTDGRILYNNYGADYERVVVTEAASAIASASQTLIAVTESTSGATQYINPNYIVNMTDNATAGTDIKYYMLGAVPRIITVDDTRAALLVLIDAVIPDASGAYARLASANTFTDTTDSTSPTTGAQIISGGVGIAKALSVGTNVLLGKEVDHTISVITTTTAATVGGKVTLKGATGATSGAGGAAEIIGGTGGATAGSTGGAVNITSGPSGAGGGPSGAIPIATAAGTVTGAISITTGNGTTNSGNINITPGTSASATVASAVILDNGVVRKPFSTSVATGGTVTGPQLLKGLITVTGATGNVQLPTAAQITTALGATPTGTSIEFFVNAAGMTATNVATLVVGTNMTVMSAPAITGGGSLAVTQDTQVVGKFLLIYDTATSCKISRIA